MHDDAPPQADTSFDAQLDRAKRSSWAQLLFKSARLLNDHAIHQLREKTGMPLRAAHTTLFPHIDLGGTRITTLAERLGVTKQAVSQLVNELEDMEVVERIADPNDGRAKLVRFARSNESLLEGAFALIAIESKIGEELGIERTEQLHTLLTDLLRLLEAKDAT